MGGWEYMLEKWVFFLYLDEIPYSTAPPHGSL